MIVQINIDELKKNVTVKFELSKMISFGFFDIRCKAIVKKSWFGLLSNTTIFLHGAKWKDLRLQTFVS